MKRFDCTVTLLLLVASAGSVGALEPANPKANAQARAILNYLDGLPRRADKRLLSGQFTDAGRTAKLAMCAEVHEKTGHWPAMIGLDFADFPKGGLEYATVNRVADRVRPAGRPGHHLGPPLQPGQSQGRRPARPGRGPAADPLAR